MNITCWTSEKKMTESVDSNTEIEILETCSHQNGRRSWLAKEFMHRLGYSSWETFRKVINRAMVSCAKLDLDVSEAFEQVRGEDGRLVDFKLNRFACFLISTFADDKKPEVQRVKIALSAFAEAIIQSAIDSNSVLRIETREDLKSAEKLLSSAAKEAEVQPSEFGIFKDAGFRGMYNMPLAELRSYKGVYRSGSTTPVLYDFMGITELAGNLFRDTQTAERIRSKGVKGLRDAAASAKAVGKEVREMMFRNSGTNPEDLPIEEDVRKVKSRLKKASRTMIKHDKK